MRPILFALALLTSLPALAADKTWAPAPVPAVGPATTVAPAQRAGRSDGPDHAAPFSGVPTGTVSTDGAVSSNNGPAAGTPSLSR